jgi:hypothetical protein
LEVVSFEAPPKAAIDRVWALEPKFRSFLWRPVVRDVSELEALVDIFLRCAAYVAGFKAFAMIPSKKE